MYGRPCALGFSHTVLLRLRPAARVPRTAGDERDTPMAFDEQDQEALRILGFTIAFHRGGFEMATLRGEMTIEITQGGDDQLALVIKLPVGHEFCALVRRGICTNRRKRRSAHDRARTSRRQGARRLRGRRRDVRPDRRSVVAPYERSATVGRRPSGDGASPDAVTSRCCREPRRLRENPEVIFRRIPNGVGQMQMPR